MKLMMKSNSGLRLIFPFNLSLWKSSNLLFLKSKRGRSSFLESKSFRKSLNWEMVVSPSTGVIRFNSAIRKHRFSKSRADFAVFSPIETGSRLEIYFTKIWFYVSLSFSFLIVFSIHLSWKWVITWSDAPESFIACLVVISNRRSLNFKNSHPSQYQFCVFDSSPR